MLISVPQMKTANTLCRMLLGEGELKSSSTSLIMAFMPMELGMHQNRPLLAIASQRPNYNEPVPDPVVVLLLDRGAAVPHGRRPLQNLHI